MPEDSPSIVPNHCRHPCSAALRDQADHRPWDHEARSPLQYGVSSHGHPTKLDNYPALPSIRHGQSNQPLPLLTGSAPKLPVLAHVRSPLTAAGIVSCAMMVGEHAELGMRPDCGPSRMSCSLSGTSFVMNCS
jgi:hypothetical protein